MVQSADTPRVRVSTRSHDVVYCLWMVDQAIRKEGSTGTRRMAALVLVLVVVRANAATSRRHEGWWSGRATVLAGRERRATKVRHKGRKECGIRIGLQALGLEARGAPRSGVAICIGGVLVVGEVRANSTHVTAPRGQEPVCPMPPWRETWVQRRTSRKAAMHVRRKMREARWVYRLEGRKSEWRGAQDGCCGVCGHPWGAS